MMDGMDNDPEIMQRNMRSVSVDLTDNSLKVDISDALSEKDKVKFTVHTKTTMKEFKGNEFSVVRQHEEFVWLHDSLVEDERYAGLLIPPPPLKPDFDASREKLAKLSEGEGSMTKEEFTRMKAELEAEYLAIFKKTVAMHEIFLQRLTQHTQLKTNHNFRVFLEFEKELGVRGKNKKEKLTGLFRKVTKTADEALLLSNQKDSDEFYEHEKLFMNDYNSKIRDATSKSDRITKTHKQCLSDLLKITSCLQGLSTVETSVPACKEVGFDKTLLQVHDTLEKARKTEGRMCCDADLKLSDLLRYYSRDSQACKDLLYRRSKVLAQYEKSNKDLDNARAKGKNVQQAVDAQKAARSKFEKLSEVGKEELIQFKSRRVQAFRKNLLEFGELQIKHSKAMVNTLKTCIANLEQL